MILNVSSRTDIVHYYTPWFLERLREGRAIVPNPEVPDHAMELDLSPESVQGIVFCSKDSPFRDAFAANLGNILYEPHI